jgi:hypothetical protein
VISNAVRAVNVEYSSLLQIPPEIFDEYSPGRTAALWRTVGLLPQTLGRKTLPLETSDV